MEPFSIRPICFIRTPFKDKFGIPRQSGLIPEAIGELIFENNNFNREALRGINGFSHLWINFIFHKAIGDGEKSLVRPPRLGGKEKMGVWATRSPHRPNHLGQTVVELVEVVEKKDEILIRVGGIDLLDGTPIIDIKPYIAYCDSIKNSTMAWVPEPKDLIKPTVKWAEGTRDSISTSEANLIEKVLQEDPRPTSQKFDKDFYVFDIFKYSVKFKSCLNDFTVISVSRT